MLGLYEPKDKDNVLDSRHKQYNLSNDELYGINMSKYIYKVDILMTLVINI